MSAPHALDFSFPASRLFRVAAAFLLLFLLAFRAFAGQSTLAWDPSTDTKVTGYKLYYGQASNNYTTSIDVGNVTTYTVLNLAEGKTYYYVVRARDVAGTESAPSNEVSGAIPIAAPVASFGANVTSGVAPLTVNFTSTATGNITAYAWSFGDGTSSASASPSKAYSTPGTYTVSLTVTGPGGTNTATKTSLITVTATPPVAGITASASNGTAPLTVQFTSASTGTISNYAWNFGNGTTSNVQNPPAVTYSAAASYPVTLTVIGPGGSSTKSATITVAAPAANQAPNGTIVSPVTPLVVTEGQSVAFQAVGSDPDGNTPLTYSWDFGGAAAVSTAQNPTVTFARAGTYNVSVRVTDAKGLADPTPATLAVTVNVKPNQAPSGTIVTPATAITIKAGQSVAFQASGTDPDGNTPLTFSWDFGGGAAATTSQNPSATFANAGTYAVKMTVTDAKGLSDPTPAITSVTVDPAPASSTGTVALAPSMIWSPTAKPMNLDRGDATAVTLGVKFSPRQNGFITGIRFYKSAANTGRHVAALWTQDGRRLVTAVFANETASGWQQVNLPIAVPVVANTTYVASYFAPYGHFSWDDNYFTNASVTNGPLTALAGGQAGGNGVYAYGSRLAFPGSSYKDRNYWVDVIFQAAK